jgi:phage shock protein C
MAWQPPTTSRRLLRRSRHDRIIAGVCGGLGAYLGVDPVLIRVAFVVLAIAGGSGFLIYLVSWLVIPKERPGEPVAPDRRAGSGATGRLLLGAALIALGSVLLIDRVVPWFDLVAGPMTLVGLGVAVLVWGVRR